MRPDVEGHWGDGCLEILSELKNEKEEEGVNLQLNNNLVDEENKFIIGSRVMYEG